MDDDILGSAKAKGIVKDDTIDPNETEKMGKGNIVGGDKAEGITIIYQASGRFKPAKTMIFLDCDII